MRKNYFRIILASLIMFSLFINVTKISEAGENSSIYDDYLVENLDDIKRIIEVTENNDLNDSVVIKNGFKFNETMIYPVMANNKILSYLMVYYDDTNSLNWALNGIIPEHILKDMKVNEENVEIYNLNKILLNETKSDSTFMDIEYDYSNLNWNNVEKLNIRTSSSNTRIIPLRIIEIQENKPWCSAYAASAIINTKDRNQTTTAYSIMNHFEFPSGLTDSQIQKYSHYRGYKTSMQSTLSMDQIRGQINNNSPIYLDANRYENGVVKARHALVLSGYDVGSNKAYVWNPWGYYTWFSISTKSIPLGSFKFKWDLSIIGWNK